MTTCFTVLEYLYRDASNYKAWGAILLEGSCTPADETLLRTYLDSGEYFIPGKVGIDCLQPRIWSAGFPPNSDDHDFHEFIELRSATAEDLLEMPVWESLNELLQRFQRAHSRSTAACL